MVNHSKLIYATQGGNLSYVKMVIQTCTNFIYDKIARIKLRAWPSGKASAFQADIRGSESRRPLSLTWTVLYELSFYFRRSARLHPNT
jgi:hypothetical protein